MQCPSTLVFWKNFSQHIILFYFRIAEKNWDFHLVKILFNEMTVTNEL